MSVIPEYILQTVIARGIRTLREDSKYIEQLFRNESQGDLESIKNFIKTKAISFNLNYPKKQVEIPAIVLLLKTDSESEAAYLNDTMGIEIPDEFGYDGGISGELLGTAANTEDLSNPTKRIFGPWYVLSATNNTLKVSDRTFIANEYVGETVHLVKGTGVGQIRTIVSNGHNVLMVDANWDIVPDSTTVFEIKESTGEVLGEPSRLYDRADSSVVLERKGSMYDQRYQAQLIAGSPQEVVYLYAILKSILTLSRTFLEGQGIIALKMSGTDLVLKQEYVPEYSFTRTLNLEFKHPFDVYKPLEDLATSFIIKVCEGTTPTEIFSTEPVSLTEELTIGGP